MHKDTELLISMITAQAARAEEQADEQARKADEQARKADEQARKAEEQARKADEQARKAEEQAKETLRCFQLQMEATKRVEDTLRAEFGLVKTELKEIKSKVLVIHGRVIGELTSATEAEIMDIQSDLETALADPEVIEQLDAIATGLPVQVRKPNGQFANKKYQRITILSAFLNYFGVSFSPSEHRKQPGQFGARLMRQITQVDFGSAYPVAFAPALAKLAFFYQDGYFRPKK